MKISKQRKKNSRHGETTGSPQSRCESCKHYMDIGWCSQHASVENPFVVLDYFIGILECSGYEKKMES